MTFDDDFVPLDLRHFQTDQILVCDLYIESNQTHTLYREASLPFTVDDRESLLASGISHLWVKVSADDSRSRQQLVTLLGLPDDEVSPKVKGELLYGSTKAATHRVLNNPASEETLSDIHDIMRLTADCISHNRTARSALLSATCHDSSVYTHAVNVAVYALGLGRTMDIVNKRELLNLGLAAILHDVGKAHMPQRILFKPGPLSDEEWAIMHHHPTWGVEILASKADLPQDVLTIVAQHHERLDGSGYPHGLSGAKLHRYSMVVAMADAYDAMTCDRPYRPAKSPFEALSILKGEAVSKFGVDLFAGMVRFLGDVSESARSSLAC
ncbi:MAG: HD domain-containing protein [Chloroflexi bacterium]|nr:HD domain-containing protein [Chloroflexota bacterium]